MNAAATPAPARAEAHPLAAAFVLAVMIVGCAVLWIGVPLGGMWLASVLSDSFGAHAPIALALILPGMFAAGAGLAWLNGLYIRLTGPNATLVGGLPVRRRGPLEPLLVLCFFLALGALFFWFFFLAENPGNGVFGTG